MMTPPRWQSATDELLRQIVMQRRVGLITDMDGTISPIVSNPAEALPTERSRELLAALHEHLTLVAVVSGRAVVDVRERVGLPQLVYSGNHGLEMWKDGGVLVTPEIAMYRDDLQAARDTILSMAPPGMLVEDKAATLSVHYRNTPDPETVGSDMQPRLAKIAAENNLRLFAGRMVFELRPPLEIDKGVVFRQLVEDYQLDSALYIGDDTTDADALRMARLLRTEEKCVSAGLGVQSEDVPSVVLETADFTVDGVAGVEEFLGWLLTCVRAS